MSYHSNLIVSEHITLFRTELIAPFFQVTCFALVYVFIVNILQNHSNTTQIFFLHLFT